MKPRTSHEIETTVREMDREYDANFGDWVRNQENVGLISANIKKYVQEYTEETFAEVLRWITKKWHAVQQVALLKKLFHDELFEENTSDNFQLLRKKLGILKNVMSNWSALQVSELLTEFLRDMKKDDKKIFLTEILQDYDQQKITEIFIRIDNLIDWSLKLSIIKQKKQQISPAPGRGDSPSYKTAG